MGDTDLELLARYTQHQAEDAFAEIVRRHLGLVHSAALRQVRLPQLAEEVAQSTFLKLARHAQRLAPDTVLSAWLYQVTRREALDVIRREARLHLREQIATEMSAINATATDWTHIEPLLDEAMHALKDTDRIAVLLRYFENKSLREVGVTLGTSEAAAQKRLGRAVERLREFFAKRGVTIAASGLVVAISANAVQAAPLGLAITVSAAATFTVSAVATTAATTTIKTIAMTTLQKTLIAATLVAAVSTGIYETRQISNLRTQVQALQQQQAPLAEQIERLTGERDNAMSQLATLRDDARLKGNNTELVKLRGEVSRLRVDSQELAKSKAGNFKDATESSAKSWVNRVGQLKQRLEQNPPAMIPELKFVTEQDWLDAAKEELKTDADYRRALAALRAAGERKFASMTRQALTAYMQANNGQFPSDLAQLQQHFASPVDDVVLQRWEIALASTVKSLGLGGDVIITQRAPVDDVFDTRFGIGPGGSGSTDFLSREIEGVIKPVREAFRAANQGQWATANSQLLPFVSTPEQQAAVQKLMLRESGSK
jgi:RNA polymerase sigma factor (sigma-70 family)